MFKWFKRKKEKREAEGQEIIKKNEAMKSEEKQPEGIKMEPDQAEKAGEREQKEGKSGFGFINRLKQRLSKTRQALTSRIDGLFLGKKQIDEEVLEELEEILIMADLGVKATQELIQTITKKVSHKEINNVEELKKVLKEEIFKMISINRPDFDIERQRPFVVMMVGVNGVGKTTTIAKLAKYYYDQGKKVLLVAADTFRAAAIEQLQAWAQRVGVDIYSQQSGADPAAVAFDGVQLAKNKGYDIVFIDTAGRLHTKINLMEELKKIKRVIQKIVPAAPHEIFLVLDATTGQNATSQTKLFNEALGITGIIMTKLDGTAKGGILVSVAHEFRIPIHFIGIGEKMDDLKPFDPEAFVEALF